MTFWCCNGEKRERRCPYHKWLVGFLYEESPSVDTESTRKTGAVMGNKEVIGAYFDLLEETLHLKWPLR